MRWGLSCEPKNRSVPIEDGDHACRRTGHLFGCQPLCFEFLGKNGEHSGRDFLRHHLGKSFVRSLLPQASRGMGSMTRFATASAQQRPELVAFIPAGDGDTAATLDAPPPGAAAVT